ncbi:MAG: DUF5681 domain-containing protein [Stellaceae bacterium]
MVDSKQNEPDYEVGYGRPPKAGQVKPGERRNPAGRPRGSPNMRGVLGRALQKKIPVPQGDKTCKVPGWQAITDTAVLQAARGDRHARKDIFALVVKTGMLGDDAAQRQRVERVVPAAGGARPGDEVFKDVVEDALTEEERIELAGIAERVDDCGGIKNLTVAEFARFKELEAKGVRQDVPSYQEAA